MKEQGLFHTAKSPEPVFTDTLTLDLSKVEPSIAGPRRPQDRIRLSEARRSFRDALPSLLPAGTSLPGKEAAKGSSEGPAAVGVWGEGSPESPSTRAVMLEDAAEVLDHGSVVIAAITSCTNTSNPSVMLAAGLLAKKAVERGLRAETLGQDVAGAGFQGRDGLSTTGRGSRLIWTSWASISWDMAAPPASATRARFLSKSPRPFSGGSWWPARSCPATATSKAGSTPTCGRTI